jgi:hypothetical protein
MVEQIFEEYCSISYKNTSKIIKDNYSFFTDLINKDIDEIFIIGQSFGDVDIPYFKEIDKILKSKDIKWNASYHLTKDENIFKEKLLSIGINQNNIRLFRIGDFSKG